jgi:hypothetical protein
MTADAPQEFTSKPYTIAIEVSLRSPGSVLQDVVDYVKSPECQIKGLVMFAPLGDMHPADGVEMK